MTPDQVAVAAPLLIKRAALVSANEHPGPDDTYFLRTRHLNLEFYAVCQLEKEEIQEITCLLIERIDETLKSLGVDISGLP